MTTQTQTAKYDRGYEDAIEGRPERSADPFYVKGYRAGTVLRLEAEAA